MEHGALIHPGLVAETKRLLALGTISQRKVATRVGISRGSVGNIFHGRRRDAPDPGELNPDEVVFYPATRCTGCGGKIHITPCRLCKARAVLAAAQRRPGQNDPRNDRSLNLNLSPTEQARYATIHERKKREGENQTADAWLEPLDEAEADPDEWD